VLLYLDSECDKYIFEHEARVDCLSRLSAASFPSRSSNRMWKKGSSVGNLAGPI